ncbi:MAG TPA: acetyltransferase [Chitinophagales bacterium]|nr:acetyltransferase [Chitinophagales bacterium]
MSHKKLIIFGTGDIAQIANYYFHIDSEYDVAAFAVNEAYIQESTFEGLPVVAFENIEEQFPPSRFDMFIATSYAKLNRVREQKYNEAKAKGYKLATYLSSRCSYMSQYAPGDNCFIFEDNTVQPFVKIGNNVTLWSGNHIGHHSIIYDHNFVASHVVISGRCEIMSNCFLGVNVTLHNNVTIAPNNVIGAGAVIARNTEPDQVWLPERAKLYHKKSSDVEL